MAFRVFKDVYDSDYLCKPGGQLHSVAVRCMFSTSPEAEGGRSVLVLLLWSLMWNLLHHRKVLCPIFSLDMKPARC